MRVDPRASIDTPRLPRKPPHGRGGRLQGSIDGGHHWTRVNPTCPITALAVDPARTSTLYAGVYRGHGPSARRHSRRRDGNLIQSSDDERGGRRAQADRGRREMPCPAGRSELPAQGLGPPVRQGRDRLVVVRLGTDARMNLEEKHADRLRARGLGRTAREVVETGNSLQRQATGSGATAFAAPRRGTPKPSSSVRSTL